MGCCHTDDLLMYVVAKFEHDNFAMCTSSSSLRFEPAIRTSMFIINGQHNGNEYTQEVPKT